MDQTSSDISMEMILPSEQFVQAYEKIGLYWWSWDHRNRHLTMSPALLKVLGYSQKEFDPSSPTIYKNIHPDDARENINRIRKLLSGEESWYEIDYRIKDKKGNWNWYYNRGIVIQRDREGKAVLVGGISMDMSGQFTHMLSNVQEKDKFEFIFRNSNEAIVIFELEETGAGKILEANSAAFELFGWYRKEPKKDFPAEYLADDLTEVMQTLSTQVLLKGFGRVEQNLKLNDRRILWLDISAHAFTLTGENLMIAIMADRTPVRQTEAALRESEKLYRTLFEAADDRIGLFTTEGEPILVNSSFYGSLGYTREEFMSSDFLEHVHPEDREGMEIARRKIMKMGYGSYDYRARHKEGNFLHMSSKIVVIKGDPGEKDLVLFIIRDVSDRIKAVMDLELAKERAEESDQLKSAFLANMSHEIRTPMNSIVGFSNLLVNPELDEEIRSLYVERIIRNSELLLALISDIIDLAKIESGQLSIIYGRHKLSRLFSELEIYAKEEAGRLDKGEIGIHMETDETDFLVETDLFRVTQIMKNLINNAIKFTDQGDIRIGCRYFEDVGKVLLFVRDTGIGISRENLGLIFDQFRQADGSDTRKFGGTGLGLAICKNLVEMMGGVIWAESEPGNGSLFQVELPVKAPGIVKAGAERKTPAARREKVPGKLSILVVDDQPDTLELFRFLLTSKGHSVVTAVDGFEALRLLEQGPLPQLIFMDVQMPVLSGTDTMRLAKERYPEILVVAQSAHALLGDRKRFLAEGYDAYLPKPFSEDQLLDLLSDLKLD